MYRLPELAYAFDALKPYIDAATMKLHYTKHHQAYLDGFNKLMADEPQLAQYTPEALLAQVGEMPIAVRERINNFGGGFVNHAFFWKIMAPAQSGQRAPVGTLRTVLLSTFGDLPRFEAQFSAAAKSVFGSGWAWLVLTDAGELRIITTPNQESPLSRGMKPLLGLDVWEHAYYLHYQNRRADYITAWWHVVNWDYAEELYRSYTR